MAQLNTLLAFPFYQLSGQFAAASALLMDMYTGKPVELTNDEDMQHVWVYDWGSAAGRRLFLTFVQDAIASGRVDGLFADKWGYPCKEVNASTWKICNNKCGYVTPAQGQAYNNGSIALREAVSKVLKIKANYSSSAEFGGLLYAGEHLFIYLHRVSSATLELHSVSLVINNSHSRPKYPSGVKMYEI